MHFAIRSYFVPSIIIKEQFTFSRTARKRISMAKTEEDIQNINKSNPFDTYKANFYNNVSKPLKSFFPLFSADIDVVREIILSSDNKTSPNQEISQNTRKAAQQLEEGFTLEELNSEFQENFSEKDFAIDGKRNWESPINYCKYDTEPESFLAQFRTDLENLNINKNIIMFIQLVFYQNSTKKINHLNSNYITNLYNVLGNIIINHTNIITRLKKIDENTVLIQQYSEIATNDIHDNNFEKIFKFDLNDSNNLALILVSEFKISLAAEQSKIFITTKLETNYNSQCHKEVLDKFLLIFNDINFKYTTASFLNYSIKNLARMAAFRLIETDEVIYVYKKLPKNYALIFKSAIKYYSTPTKNTSSKDEINDNEEKIYINEINKELIIRLLNCDATDDGIKPIEPISAEILTDEISKLTTEEQTPVQISFIDSDRRVKTGFLRQDIINNLLDSNTGKFLSQEIGLNNLLFKFWPENISMDFFALTARLRLFESTDYRALTMSTLTISTTKDNFFYVISIQLLMTGEKLDEKLKNNSDLDITIKNFVENAIFDIIFRASNNTPNKFIYSSKNNTINCIDHSHYLSYKQNNSEQIISAIFCMKDTKKLIPLEVWDQFINLHITEFLSQLIDDCDRFVVTCNKLIDVNQKNFCEKKYGRLDWLQDKIENGIILRLYIELFYLTKLAYQILNRTRANVDATSLMKIITGNNLYNSTYDIDQKLQGLSVRKFPEYYTVTRNLKFLTIAKKELEIAEHISSSSQTIFLEASNKNHVINLNFTLLSLENIKDQELILKNLSHYKFSSITLVDCIALNDITFKEIIKNSGDELQEVVLEGNCNITNHSIDLLKKYCPKLVILKLIRISNQNFKKIDVNLNNLAYFLLDNHETIRQITINTPIAKKIDIRKCVSLEQFFIAANSSTSILLVECHKLDLSKCKISPSIKQIDLSDYKPTNDNISNLGKFITNNKIDTRTISPFGLIQLHTQHKFNELKDLLDIIKPLICSDYLQNVSTQYDDLLTLILCTLASNPEIAVPKPRSYFIHKKKQGNSGLFRQPSLITGYTNNKESEKPYSIEFIIEAGAKLFEELPFSPNIHSSENDANYIAFEQAAINNNFILAEILAGLQLSIRYLTLDSHSIEVKKVIYRFKIHKQPTLNKDIKIIYIKALKLAILYRSYDAFKGIINQIKLFAEKNTPFTRVYEDIIDNVLQFIYKTNELTALLILKEFSIKNYFNYIVDSSDLINQILFADLKTIENGLRITIEKHQSLQNVGLNAVLRFDYEIIKLVLPKSNCMDVNKNGDNCLHLLFSAYNYFASGNNYEIYFQLAELFAEYLDRLLFVRNYNHNTPLDLLFANFSASINQQKILYFLSMLLNHSTETVQMLTIDFIIDKFQKEIANIKTKQNNLNINLNNNNDPINAHMKNLEDQLKNTAEMYSNALLQIMNVLLPNFDNLLAKKNILDFIEKLFKKSTTLTLTIEIIKKYLKEKFKGEIQSIKYEIMAKTGQPEKQKDELETKLKNKKISFETICANFNIEIEESSKPAFNFN